MDTGRRGPKMWMQMLWLLLSRLLFKSCQHQHRLPYSYRSWKSHLAQLLSPRNLLPFQHSQCASLWTLRSISESRVGGTSFNDGWKAPFTLVSTTAGRKFSVKEHIAWQPLPAIIHIRSFTKSNTFDISTIYANTVSVG